MPDFSDAFNGVNRAEFIEEMWSPKLYDIAKEYIKFADFSQIAKETGHIFKLKDPANDELTMFYFYTPYAKFLDGLHQSARQMVRVTGLSTADIKAVLDNELRITYSLGTNADLDLKDLCMDIYILQKGISVKPRSVELLYSGFDEDADKYVYLNDIVFSLLDFPLD